MMSRAEDYERAESARRAADLISRTKAGTLTRSHFNRLFNPDYRSREFSEISLRYRTRDLFTKQCSWCVPTANWSSSIARLVRGKGRVLEVCAGRGTIAALMQRHRKVEWIATDVESEDDHVAAFDAMDAVSEYKPDIIFASWIPYECSLDGDLAELGLPLIVVGEGCGGCTGDGSIWEHEPEGAAELYPWFEDVPQWDGIHDYTSLTHWPRD